MRDTLPLPSLLWGGTEGGGEKLLPIFVLFFKADLMTTTVFQP